VSQGKIIKLTESERNLVSKIGLEKHGELSEMATSIMQSVTITIPAPKEDSGVVLKKVIMHVSVFSAVDGVDEDLCSTGLVTIDV